MRHELLTGELLDQIVGHYGLRFGTRHHELRDSLRLPLATRAGLVASEAGRAGKPVLVRVRDISVAGIGLLCSRPLEAGARFVVCLARRGAKPLRIYCSSVRCWEISDDLYQVGGGFISVLEQPITARPSV